MSSRRRPMTSPPGGEQRDLAAAREQRRRRAGSRRECAAHSSGSSSPARTVARVDPQRVVAAVHSHSAPTLRTSSTSVSMSRMRGTFSSVHRCSVSSAAATIGSAAFLLPAGRMVPDEALASFDEKANGRHAQWAGDNRVQRGTWCAAHTSTPDRRASRSARRIVPRDHQRQGVYFIEHWRLLA